MKFTTWPEPPIIKSEHPPQIPSRLRSFGLEYIVEDGNPRPDIPQKPLEKRKIEEWINESYGLFVRTLQTLDGSHLNRIREIHTNMNEEINKAIIYEKERVEIESKEIKTRMKNEVLENIKRAIRKCE